MNDTVFARIPARETTALRPLAPYLPLRRHHRQAGLRCVIDLRGIWQSI
jgi:hypothetical protein